MFMSTEAPVTVDSLAWAPNPAKCTLSTPGLYGAPLSTWALHSTLWTVYKGNQVPLPCEARHVSTYLSCRVSACTESASESFWFWDTIALLGENFLLLFF